MNEYEMLRAEIIEELTGIRTYESGMYAVVAAILAFTIDSDYYLACLLPYLVIISVFFVTTGIRASLHRLGTYLNVFHEGSVYNWERRHGSYDKQYLNIKEGNIRWSTRSPYYLLSFSCSLVSLIKLLTDSRYSVNHKAVASIGIIAFTIVVFLLFYWNTFNHMKDRPQVLERWKKMRDAETEKIETSAYDSIPLTDNIDKRDQVVIKSFMELILLVLENSKTKEEAVDAIRNLSIMKSGDKDENH